GGRAHDPDPKTTGARCTPRRRPWPRLGRPSSGPLPSLVPGSRGRFAGREDRAGSVCHNLAAPSPSKEEPVRRSAGDPMEPVPGSPEAQADQQHLDQLRRARQARVAKYVVVLVIVVILIVFIVANAKPVRVSYVFVTGHPRLIWVMLFCAVFGGIAGYLLGRPGKQVRFHRGEQQK